MHCEKSKDGNENLGPLATVSLKRYVDEFEEYEMNSKCFIAAGMVFDLTGKIYRVGI